MQEQRERRTAIEDALEAELERFLQIAFGLWVAFAALGLIASVFVATSISIVLGAALALTCAVYLSFWLPTSIVLARAGLSPLLRRVADVVEVSSPWVIILMLSLAAGPAYALASWLPPSLFMMVLFSHTLQLRKWSPLVIGVTGALAFPVLYLAVLAPNLPTALSNGVVEVAAPVQLLRTLWILVGGVAAWLLARLARASLVRVQSQARARELFGKYRLVRRVARGGMGEVFEASYASEGGFERRVAVKRIHPHLAEDEKFVRYFHREAEICAHLAHPNVVQVFDFGRIDGDFYLAMEYVDGMTLAELINCAREREQEIPEPVVRAILRGLIAGLQHAHEGVLGPNGDPLRIIHRDLCPHNVLLSQNGEVKITDFGVACALEDATPSSAKSIAGHAAYMAPEMVRGESVDERSDIFALGVVTWEILAGQRLFARSSRHETLEALMRLEVAPARPNADPAWDALLDRALSRDPDLRFQSMRAVSTALDAIRITKYEHDARAIARFLEQMRQPPDPVLLISRGDTVIEHAMPMDTFDTSTLKPIDSGFFH